MKYQHIEKATFLERPNRFIAYVELNGKREKVHVKNTGRCRELLTDHATVYLEKSDNAARSTVYDLVCVEKKDRLINMDSQAPNKVVGEWLKQGGLFSDTSLVRPETVYGSSRFDFYVETAGGRKIFIEVKGVTLEEQGIASFPDAPSERAVKHVEELTEARKKGYEAYVLFVVQMDGIRYVLPNRKTHPEFAQALMEAREQGVKVIAYDCEVKPDSLSIRNPLPVFVSGLEEVPKRLLFWYDKEHRSLPWREEPTPYHVWLSEIMLQQTRVEAVKPYYKRFLDTLPDIKALAEVEEERLLKLWEGLGYYNRARNLQKAARQIMEEYGGEMPSDYEELKKLAGIGSYTAGAISSIAFGKTAPAVDGNVLRVLSRVRKDGRDILLPKTRDEMEKAVMEVMPKERPGDFNQALMELGAMVCLPNGEPKCTECPLQEICMAKTEDCVMDYPVKKKGKERTKEEKTVLILLNDKRIALKKRSERGLLAGMYELPCMEGKRNKKEVLDYLHKLEIYPLKIESLGEAKHVFSHREWHMKGYLVHLDELAGTKEQEESLSARFVAKKEIERKFPIPSAYAAYTERIMLTQGNGHFGKKRKEVTL